MGASVEPWTLFVSLGVPGLALGIFYMLWQKFDWKFATVPQRWVGPLAFFFMLCATAIIFTALILWAPQRQHDDVALKPANAKISASEFVNEWLTILDKGDYASSWQSLDYDQKLKFDQLTWVSTSDSNRKPLGQVLDRNLQLANTVPTQPNDGPGPTIEFTYKTSFQNGTYMEFVWLTLDQTGTWQVSGYYLYRST